MKRKIICFSLVLLLLCSGCSSCKPDVGKIGKSQSFYFMDTVISVTLYGVDQATANELFRRCENELSRLDALWNRDGSASEISALNAQKILNSPSPETLELLRTAEKIRDVSGKRYTVTIAPLVDLWKSCSEENRLPTEPELQTAKEAVSNAVLTFSENEIHLSGGELDMGSIGKGAAAESLRKILSASSAVGGLITFGSNVAVFGKKPDGKPYRIGIRDPKDASASVGTLTLAPEEILSVSGDYERFSTINGERYHHILCPQTGYPAESGLSSVAVIAKDGALADALSTALFVMGEESAMELYRSKTIDFEAIFTDGNGNTRYTDGLQGKFSPRS